MSPLVLGFKLLVIGVCLVMVVIIGETGFSSSLIKLVPPIADLPVVMLPDCEIGVEEIWNGGGIVDDFIGVC